MKSILIPCSFSLPLGLCLVSLHSLATVPCPSMATTFLCPSVLYPALSFVLWPIKSTFLCPSMTSVLLYSLSFLGVPWPSLCLVVGHSRTHHGGGGHQPCLQVMNHPWIIDFYCVSIVCGECVMSNCCCV